MQWLGLCSAVFLLAGCASDRGRPLSPLHPVGESDTVALAQAQQALAHRFPDRYRAVQRVIITVRRRQFVCDGVLTVSPTEGHHLAVVSPLGVVTDVRLRPDGTGEVSKVTALFREIWSRDFVLRDLRWLFAPPPLTAVAGRLEDGRVACQTAPDTDGVFARYIFAPDGERMEGLELCRAGRSFYQAVVCRYRTVAGYPYAVPAEFEVNAGPYRLNLRNVELHP